MCTYTESVMNDGVKKGMEQGMEKAIFDSVKEGDYSAERGAEKLGITLEEFNERRKKAGYVVD